MIILILARVSTDHSGSQIYPLTNTKSGMIGEIAKPFANLIRDSIILFYFYF